MRAALPAAIADADARFRPPARPDTYVAAAFFDAYLAGDQSARCWLARSLAAENPDVETRRR